MSGINYFEVLELKAEDIRGWREARVHSEVEQAYKRLHRQSMQASGRPRPDGRSQREWRDLLKTARDVLSDEVRRERHIKELTGRQPVRERMSRPRPDPKPRGKGNRRYGVRPLEGASAAIGVGVLLGLAMLAGTNPGAGVVTFALGWLATLLLSAGTARFWIVLAGLGGSLVLGATVVLLPITELSGLWRDVAGRVVGVGGREAGANGGGGGRRVERPTGASEPDFGRSTWQRVQRGLRAEDLYGGAIDGVPGRGTRRGIREWQAARAMKVTGYLDAAQAEELIALAESDASPARPEIERESVAENAEEIEHGAEREARAGRTGDGGVPEGALKAADSLEIARDRFDAGDYEATVDAVRALLQAQADDSAAHLLLGQALYALGRFEASIEPLRRAIGLGERVELEARHRHGVGEFRQGFCRGALTFAGGDVMFRSDEDDSHDFHVAADRLTDVEVLERIDGQPFWLTSRVQDRGSQRRRVDFVHRNVLQQFRSGNSRYSAILGCSDCDGSLGVQAALMQAGG